MLVLLAPESKMCIRFAGQTCGSYVFRAPSLGMWQSEGKAMTGTLDYGSIMNKAMRFFVQQVLQEVSENGLPGTHHFFITLDTNHEGLEMAPWLLARYPKEITIVMQHWFENLDVDDAGFSVTLNFGNNPEPLYVPYDAIITFVDPSVEFGVKFEHTEGKDISGDVPASIDLGADDNTAIEPEQQSADSSAQPKKTKYTKADVVSLDAFRKS